MTTEHADLGHDQEARSQEPQSGGHASVSRRTLLRGASVALPTIFTLRSGAALAAQSANMIGTVSSASRATGPGGYIQCLDGASAVGGTWRKLNLGTNPMLRVEYITPRAYYQGNSAGTAGDPTRPVTIESMCSTGGVYWYLQNPWSPTSQWLPTTGSTNTGIRAGFLVSATALTSFASAIKVKSYF
jgi:hypothetical protein